MDVIALFVTYPQSPLVEEPDEDALDNAAVFSQSASMGGVFFCNLRNDPLGSQGSANLFLGIVGPAGIQLSWVFAPSTARALDGRDRIH